MPRAPKPCALCDTIVPPGRTYCGLHQPVGWNAHPSPRNTKYTRNETRAFHDTVLAREPRCRICGSQATEADHIVPVSQGGTNDPDTNGQGLCTIHHQRKTRAEARGRATPSPTP